MHHIYQTRALILDAVSSGEANRFLTCLTDELGMVRATAQGVRKIESKLRYNLQAFSVVNLELVRGREVWRVTNVHTDATFSWHQLSPEGKLVVARLSRLLIRLMPGEGVQYEVFADTIASLSLLQTAETREEVAGIEYLMVMRLLFHLGYLDPQNQLESLVHSDISTEQVQDAFLNRALVLQHINQSLKETQL